MSELQSYASEEIQLNGFNPQRFTALTEAKRSFARPSKFLARIPPPRGFGGIIELQNTAKELEFWCDSAALPGAALATRDVARYGYGVREKRPITNIFQDINFTFYADGGTEIIPNVGTNWDFFTSWIRMISNFDMSEGAMMEGGMTALAGNVQMAPYELSYKTEYVTDIDIAVFRPDGSESHHVVLRDAFPTYVQEIKTAWADGQQIMQIPVLMTYTDWFVRYQPFSES